MTGPSDGRRGSVTPAGARDAARTASTSSWPARARGPLAPVPTAVLAAVTLVAAFAVALGTGARWAGGVVLLLGVAWCAWRSWRAAGPVRVVAVVALGAVCFAGSHVLAPMLGAWPSVLVAAAVLGGGTALLVDRQG